MRVNKRRTTGGRNGHVPRGLRRAYNTAHEKRMRGTPRAAAAAALLLLPGRNSGGGRMTEISLLLLRASEYDHHHHRLLWSSSSPSFIITASITMTFSGGMAVVLPASPPRMAPIFSPLSPQLRCPASIKRLAPSPLTDARLDAATCCR